MREPELRIPIGHEFITGDPRTSEAQQKYSVVGIRSDQIVLAVEGQKDGPYDRVIVERLTSVLDGRVARQQIIRSISPEEKLKALRAGEELVTIAHPEFMDAERVDVSGLWKGDSYLVRAKRVDGELAVLTAQFVDHTTDRRLLSFNTGVKKSGSMPIRAGRNSVTTLDVRDGEFILNSGIIVPKEQGLPAIGVTIWQPRLAS